MRPGSDPDMTSSSVHTNDESTAGRYRGRPKQVAYHGLASTRKVHSLGHSHRSRGTGDGVKPLQHTSMQLILHVAYLRASCFGLTRVPAPLARAAGFRLRQEARTARTSSEALVGRPEAASSIDQTAVRCKATDAGDVRTATKITRRCCDAQLQVSRAWQGLWPGI